MDNVSDIVWFSVIAAALLIWSVLTLMSSYEGKSVNSIKKVKGSKKTPVRKTATKKSVTVKSKTTKK